jgi:hypothetical protein
MPSTSTFALSTLAVLLAGSCATAAPPRNPQASTAASESALRAAEAIGASDNPRAALHLQYAKEHLERANELSGDQAARRAPGLLMRAQADAELALALAKSSEATTHAKAAADQLARPEPSAP